MNKRLKNLRTNKGVTQKEVAYAIGIALTTYANYEQGTREPSIETIVKLCKYFECSADYLLGLTDY